MNTNGTNGSNGNGHHAVDDLNEVELCYTAAFIYGLRLIDEQAASRGELVLPGDSNNNYRIKCEPEIDYVALREFVQIVGTRIAVASNL